MTKLFSSGQLVMVKYGALGDKRQMAMVVRDEHPMFLTVRKWSASSKKWNKHNHRIPRSDVLPDKPPEVFVRAARGDLTPPYSSYKTCACS